MCGNPEAVVSMKLSNKVFEKDIHVTFYFFLHVVNSIYQNL